MHIYAFTTGSLTTQYNRQACTWSIKPQCFPDYTSRRLNRSDLSGSFSSQDMSVSCTWFPYLFFFSGLFFFRVSKSLLPLPMVTKHGSGKVCINFVGSLVLWLFLWLLLLRGCSNNNLKFLIITVKYLVSVHYHVSAHPLLLD